MRFPRRWLHHRRLRRTTFMQFHFPLVHHEQMSRAAVVPSTLETLPQRPDLGCANFSHAMGPYDDDMVRESRTRAPTLAIYRSQHAAVVIRMLLVPSKGCWGGRVTLEECPS